MAKERKITDREFARQAQILAALGLTESDLRDLMTVPAKIRVVRVVDETSRLDKWIDATLRLQVYNATKQKRKLLVGISVNSFEWAEYILEDFDEDDFTFMSEEYLMQIEHPGRMPDELKERQETENILAMEKYVEDFFNDFN